MTDSLYQQVLATRLLSTMLPLASPSLRRILPRQTEVLRSVIVIWNIYALRDDPKGIFVLLRGLADRVRLLERVYKEGPGLGDPGEP